MRSNGSSVLLDGLQGTITTATPTATTTDTTLSRIFLLFFLLLDSLFLRWS